MSGSPSARDAAVLEQVAYLRHELLTPVNHILGFTEIQIDEAQETGLHDYVPALAEINTRGRALLTIIEDGLGPLSHLADLKHLEERIESEAEPTLGQARELAERLHTIGSHSAALEVDLVSSALESLLAISQAMVRSEGERDLRV
jgi:signal transduction histidine kinase